MISPSTARESARRYRHIATAAVALLVVLGLAWEMWLAPLRPGGSLLALKVLPLILAIAPLLRGQRRAYQWWSMLILLYVCEGVVRGMSDPSPSKLYAWIEFLLAACAYGAIVMYARVTSARKTQFSGRTLPESDRR